jgi:hypothetical protein
MKTYGTNKKTFSMFSHLQQIGGKPISILKNNFCYDSFDEKEWNQITPS